MGLEGLASHQSTLSVSAPAAVGVCVAFQAAAGCQNSAGTHTSTAQAGGCKGNMKTDILKLQINKYFLFHVQFPA
jgi:hypothetical protein